MTTAFLKFQLSSPTPKEISLDPSVLAAPVDASPEPMAVTENGKLIYANRSFCTAFGAAGRG